MRIYFHMISFELWCRIHLSFRLNLNDWKTRWYEEKLVEAKKQIREISIQLVRFWQEEIVREKKTCCFRFSQTFMKENNRPDQTELLRYNRHICLDQLARNCFISFCLMRLSFHKCIEKEMKENSYQSLHWHRTQFDYHHKHFVRSSVHIVFLFVQWLH